VASTERVKGSPQSIALAELPLAGMFIPEWGFLNNARSIAAQWMSAVFDGKMYANGPI
jgi:hypothetical protein